MHIANPVADGLCMGGLSLLMAAATFAWTRFGTGGAWAAQFAWAAGVLVWLINWPHFAATLFRLYSRKSAREQYPVTAYLVPLFIIGGVTLCFIDPEFWAVAWVRLFLIWSPYHYSGQTIGITRLYAKRAAWNLSSWEGRWLTTMVYASFIAPILVAEGAGGGGGDYYSVFVPSLGLSPWLGRIATVVLVLASIGWVGCWALRRRKLGAGAPWICLLPVGAQICWFNLAYSNPLFLPFVPLFHSLQYLFLAWILELQERLVLAPSRARNLWTVTGFWYAVCFVGGAMLFKWIPHTIAPWTNQSAYFVEGVFIVGVQLHHFLVDGVIWRLRDRQVASPLMLRWGEWRSRISGAGVGATALVTLMLCIPRVASADGFGAFEPERYVLLETTTGSILVGLNSSHGGKRFEQSVADGSVREARIPHIERSEPAQVWSLGYGSAEQSKELVLRIGPATLLQDELAIGKIENGMAAAKEMSRVRLDDRGVPRMYFAIHRARFVPADEVASIPWYPIALPAHMRVHGSSDEFASGMFARWGWTLVAVLAGAYLLVKASGRKSQFESGLGVGVVCAVLLLVACALLPSARTGGWAGLGALACFGVIVRVCNRLDRKTVI